MTIRERWQAVLEGTKPDRVPVTFRATEEAAAMLMEHLGASDMAEVYDRLHIDRRAGAGPTYVGPPIPKGEDVFGRRFRAVDYGAGIYDECINAPLAEHQTVEEIEANYTWPKIDWWDFSSIPAQVAGKQDLPISGGGSEPLLTYKQLRGESQAYMDFVDNPEIVHYCLDKLFDLAYETTRRIYEQIPGQVLLTSVSEDLGSQESLLYSPAHIHEFILPRMKRMMDLAHEAGAYVLTHSDGAIRAIIPDLIAIGMDALDPVQWRCPGMEREGLKRDFGDQLVFHGGMDNQQTLPFGSVEDVRQEVIENLRILGEGGGYILGPCHNIQAVGPPDNIVAMYDAAYEYGRL